MSEHRKNIDGREFIRLLTANQSRIYAYIVTLVPNFNDADDIMQDTTTIIWERKDDFQSGTDFVAWGVRIAYFKVLDYRKRVSRSRRMLFSDEIFNTIKEASTPRSSLTENYIQGLTDCIQKLKSNDQHLIKLRYSLGLNVKNLSQRLNSSTRSIYYSLSRIQGQLLECMERNETR
jgi:RNA polymerase sigma-70 factor (ECF subfamily)